MSTAVNAAVVVNLCAAVMWWWAARMRVEGFSVSGSVVLVGAALVGQTGGRSEMRRALVSTLGMVLATLTVLGGVAALWFGEEFSRLVEYWRYLLTLTDLERALDVEFFRRFTLRLIDSAWLVAGWLRYPAPLPWLQTMRGLTILAVVGYLIALSRPGLAHWRPGLALAGILVLIQTVGVYVGIYLNGFGAQGHYLFPALGPFMTMFWVGLHGWWPRRLWPMVSAVCVMLMLALDMVGWATVVIPAFL